MKLQNSHFQPDPHVSFLDVIFCLCVFFFLLFSVSLLTQKESNKMEEKKHKENASKIVIVEKIKEVIVEKVKEVTVQEDDKKQIHTTRFRGRGGQPFMLLRVRYSEQDGLIFNIGGCDFDWFGFRKMICNLDRRESGSQPALIFKVSYDKSYTNVSVDDLIKEFGGLLSRKEVEEAKKKNPCNYIVNLYKRMHFVFEKQFRDFKIQYTTEHLGNWDVEEVGGRSFTDYKERKQLGNPYLWFTVDNKNKQIILGPTNSPLRMDPKLFVALVASVQGGDGFYIEYRSPKTLQYDQKEKIPEWVVNSVIEPLGFAEIVSQGS